MDAEMNESVTQIFQQWQTEDRELVRRVDVLRDWMQEVNQLGIPHFGETASRLRMFCRWLTEYFEREDAMISQLAQAYPASSPEVEDVRRFSDLDHAQLLLRFEELIGRLEQTVPPFDSWEAAMEEVVILVETLEQHEENESESVRMLLAVGPDQPDNLA